MAILDSSQVGGGSPGIDLDAHALLQRTTTGLAAKLDEVILNIASERAIKADRKSVSQQDVIDAIDSTAKILLYVVGQDNLPKEAKPRLVKLISALEQSVAGEMAISQMSAQTIGLKSQIFFPTDATAIEDRRGTLGGDYGRNTRPIRRVQQLE